MKFLLARNSGRPELILFPDHMEHWKVWSLHGSSAWPAPRIGTLDPTELVSAGSIGEDGVAIHAESLSIPRCDDPAKTAEVAEMVDAEMERMGYRRG